MTYGTENNTDNLKPSETAEQETVQTEADKEAVCAGEPAAGSTGEKSKKKNRKIICITGGCAAAIIVVYFAAALYFRSHYLFHTEINGHDVSCMTVSQAEEILKADVEKYVLELKELDGTKETISAADAGVTYESAGGLKKNMVNQKFLLWPGSLFAGKTVSVKIEVTYSSEKLTDKISSLNAVTREQIPGTSAYPKFDGGKYVIEPEQFGTAVRKDALEERIIETISELEDSLDLEAEKCYAQPKYTSSSPEVKEACALMNKYCSTKIVYPMKEDVVIDAAVISGWLSVDDAMEVRISGDAVREWLEKFGDTYDTVGTKRTFTTPAGKEAAVEGGTYGWSINEKAEYEVIIDAVKNGKTLERQPEYYIGGTAATHAMPDWGDSYVDVDLSEQHMWYVADGKVKLETDVVTGLTTPERITPEGAYSILEKGRNQVLIGSTDPATGQPSYRTPVSYWMRVTWSGIGLHDATWQPRFGGTLNQIPGVGSHGCINMPLDQAGALYDMIEVGTPVVIHY